MRRSTALIVWRRRGSRAPLVLAVLALACLVFGLKGASIQVPRRTPTIVPADRPVSLIGVNARLLPEGPAQSRAPDPSAVPPYGATGTTALPPLPAAAFARVGPDATIRPARPFSLAQGSASDRGRALQCLASAIYYEAATEPDAGQRAVAQVILNRVRHPAFPGTVCGVIYQGSDHAGCQFSFACDGALARLPSRAGYEHAARVAAAALAGYVYAPVGTATHYHTYAVTPAWNRQLVMTAAIGAHFFHRWQGWWGTPAAFTRGYRGGEPVPGPLASAAPPPVVLAASPTIASIGLAAVTPPLPPPGVQPAQTDSGAVRPEALPDPRILDRWKDSGKPLR